MNAPKTITLADLLGAGEAPQAVANTRAPICLGGRGKSATEVSGRIMAPYGPVLHIISGSATLTVFVSAQELRELARMAAALADEADPAGPAIDRYFALRPTTGFSEPETAREIYPGRERGTAIVRVSWPVDGSTPRAEVARNE